MFNPKEFLNFSCEIENMKRKFKSIIALRRSIISRSYYAAFLTAREKLDELYPGYLNYDESDLHRQVIEGIKEEIDEKLGDQLYTLKCCRINADYKFTNAKQKQNRQFLKQMNPNEETVAAYARQLAEIIIDSLQNIK